MASKPRNVDLGPVYLQVGEEAVRDDAMPSADANVRDVARFDSIMRRSRDHQQHQSDAAAEMLLDPLRGAPMDLHPFAEAGDISNELAHLWVGTGLASGREVRVGLRDALLPDTSVRLEEIEGRLVIEFTCGKHRVADWLDRKLRALAHELGSRLQRPLELSVSMSDGVLIATRRWPELE